MGDCLDYLLGSVSIYSYLIPPRPQQLPRTDTPERRSVVSQPGSYGGGAGFLKCFWVILGIQASLQDGLLMGQHALQPGEGTLSE